MITGDCATNEDKKAGSSEDVQEITSCPDDSNKNNNKEKKTCYADQKTKNRSG